MKSFRGNRSNVLPAITSSAFHRPPTRPPKVIFPSSPVVPGIRFFPSQLHPKRRRRNRKPGQPNLPHPSPRVRFFKDWRTCSRAKGANEFPARTVKPREADYTGPMQSGFKKGAGTASSPSGSVKCCIAVTRPSPPRDTGFLNPSCARSENIENIFPDFQT